MRLEGKTAIVTGAGSGFGAEIARRFVVEGARVLVADLNGDAAKRVADEVMGTPFTVDVGDGAQIKAMIEAGEQLGPVDILVNNAGMTHLPMPMEDVEEEMFDRLFAVNCKSIYMAAKHLVPLMKARKSGAIVNISSTAGISPRPNLNWYNSSKGWVNTATRTMAVELAPFGIRVNAVNPVAGETPLLKSFMGEDTPEVRAKFLSTIPIGRFSTPEDIANATLYLASDEASMVTGVTMLVDGGRCI
ncbi:3-ketoacyl-ACP reductase [Oceanicola sp. 22II-s10i]|uniref:glucose 1-dehydrogenase n=1 Tax=Oceanicola sp. 22II-s10i TaxID=1317116 RepID=UPI000B521121|nr:glucose 1-dehydrogenase [Oceanicola sp. 22II-s10i]OWU85794.1 3-ketoacyl-ACP reductase [Oceanicola sp. 22II-s10i]